MSRYNLSFVITFFVILVNVFQYDLSLFWDITIPFFVYFTLVVIFGLLLSEYSNNDFKEAIILWFLRMVFLIISGTIITSIAEGNYFYTRIFMSVLVLGLVLLMQWLFVKMIITK